MINIIAGLIMSGYAGYTMYTYTGDTTIPFYLKFGGIFLAGSIVSLIELIPKLKSISLPKINFEKQTVKDNNVKELSKDIAIKDEQEQDTQCLFWLTERLKDDADALELLRKLNDSIFTLHHGSKTVK